MSSRGKLPTDYLVKHSLDAQNTKMMSSWSFPKRLLFFFFISLSSPRHSCFRHLHFKLIKAKTEAFRGLWLGCHRYWGEGEDIKGNTLVRLSRPPVSLQRTWQRHAGFRLRSLFFVFWTLSILCLGLLRVGIQGLVSWRQKVTLFQIVLYNIYKYVIDIIGVSTEELCCTVY